MKTRTLHALPCLLLALLPLSAKAADLPAAQLEQTARALQQPSPQAARALVQRWQLEGNTYGVWTSEQQRWQLYHFAYTPATDQYHGPLAYAAPGPIPASFQGKVFCENLPTYPATHLCRSPGLNEQDYERFARDAIFIFKAMPRQPSRP